MRQPRHVILAALIGFAAAGLACAQTEKAADEALDATKEGVATTIDGTRKAGDNLADTARNAAERTGDRTKDLARQTTGQASKIADRIAAKTTDLAATTGAVITDAWITAKVSAKFVDETLLNRSHIDVDTDNHVVTLRGTVASATAKSRAEAIASGTEGVTRVVNQLVVT